MNGSTRQRVEAFKIEARLRVNAIISDELDRARRVVNETIAKARGVLKQLDAMEKYPDTATREHEFGYISRGLDEALEKLTRVVSDIEGMI